MQQLNYPFAITGVGMTQISSAQQPIVPGYPNGTNGKFQNVVVQGNYAYVAASGGNGTGIIGLSLVIYNVANPQAPYVEGYLETGTVPWSSGPSYLNGAYAIAVSGQYAYIFSSGASTLYIVNISNPAAPTNVSALLISGSPGSLYSGAYSNGYVYIATQNKGLTVVNVSNPATPVQVFQEGGTTNKSVGVCVANGYCYTTNYQTTSPWTVRYLKIWSLATPSTPSLLETYTLPAGTKPAAVAVYGNTAFVSDLNTSSVQIVDVTTPTSPNYLASMQASSAFDVMNTAAVSGNYAYIASGGNATFGGAVDFYDITNLSSPVLVNTYKSNVATEQFTQAIVANNLLYIADYGTGAVNVSYLQILTTQTFWSPVIDSRNAFYASVQIANQTSSSAVGTYAVLGSNDSSSPTNWAVIPGTTGTINGKGVYLVPKFDLSYQYMQFAYTTTSPGNMTGAIKLFNGNL